MAELDEPDEREPAPRSRAAPTSSSSAPKVTRRDEAARKARFRIFGSKPGAYGAGLQSVDRAAATGAIARDLAEVYLDCGCYAYGGGRPARPRARALARRGCRSVDAVLQNQDNREHDVLDSDDYYQFHGGMSAAVELLRGSAAGALPRRSRQPEAPRVRSLNEELARVLRSRVVNPKWIAGRAPPRLQGRGRDGRDRRLPVRLRRRDRRRGGLPVRDGQRRLPAGSRENRAFLAEHNPSALREMTERLLEAMQRGMWREPGSTSRGARSAAARRGGGRCMSRLSLERRGRAGAAEAARCSCARSIPASAAS